ncbi:hypothetical protein [Desulfobotulus mexicanus]|uniref:Uncharacterized protein n=1 Tax=Desulfobotulus mexicanus TaxID=2586642 RepID=A0A5Q4VEP1_9BACT|nr:hypothetical protein [Desulfobotulus mexicanus]TYT75406.1 hypothetical protein FIM25_04800 [Desulfobotulus mexicanus]
MNRAFFKIAGFILLSWTLCNLPALAANVMTEKETAMRLQLKNTEDAAQVLNQANEQIVQRQARRNRNVRMEGIRELYDLSDKYVAVSYMATILPNTPAIAMVLFERSDTSLEMPRNFPYLFFVGPEKIADYERIDDAEICGYFREMGVSDCVPVFTQRRWNQMLSEKADKNHTHNIADIQGIIPVERIDPSLVRHSELQAALEAKADITLVKPLLIGGIAMPDGENAQLQQRIAALEAQVARLTRILEGVQRKGQNIEFQGINLVLTNGEGQTASNNGNGNLIIGYTDPAKVSGSHNLVLGEGHTCTSYGNLISGRGHKVTGSYGAAVSGTDNIVSGRASSAIGGEGNRAEGDFSATVGGRKNRAGGKNSIITGGENRSVMDANPHFTAE